MKNLLLLLMLACSYTGLAQTDYAFVYNNDSIIDKGVKLYDGDSYPDAIKEFEKISTTDPLYLKAQYEKALALSALRDTIQLKSFLENLHKQKRMEEFPELYILYGNYLSDAKELDEAEKIFKEGNTYLSQSSSFLYNYAVLYLRKEERQKCVDVLKHIVTIDPNHTSAHYLLGLLALEDGRIAEGTLALMSYLINSPTGRFAKDAIVKLNAKFGQNYLEKPKLVFSESGDNFEELETILRNQLPLNNAYKVKSEFDDVIIRQVQAVAEYTLEHKMGNGFFETTYIPWIKDMVSKNHFEGYSYYILLSLEEKLGKKLTSQKKKVMEFNEHYMLKDFWGQYAKRNLDIFGTKTEVVVMLKNGDPYLIGPMVDGKREGRFKLVSPIGNITGDLHYKNGELEGVQKYYNEKGKLYDEKTFVAGKLHGTRKEYYSNGVLSAIQEYKNDMLDGLTQTFYVNGGKQCEINFTNGETNGQLTCVYQNGTKKSEIKYTNGKWDGQAKYYNAAGDLISDFTYSNGKKHGPGIEYYDGKILKSEAKYIDGNVDGVFKSYYTNSTVERENQYEGGKIKKAFSYYPTGKISRESIYNENEELDSYNSYDANGNKYFEEVYKSGELKSGLQYSATNPKPVSVNLTKKEFTISNYFGMPLITGEFEKGFKTNEWKYMYSSGRVKLKETYKKGKQQGLSYTYNRNSTLNNISHYIDDEISGVYEGYDNGILTSRFNYAAGEQSGPYQHFYADGSVSAEGYLIDGDVNFTKTSYWQNGKTSSTAVYIDDQITSIVNYSADGKKENEIDYKNRTGKFTTSFFNGMKVETSDFVNGKLNGKHIEKDKFNNILAEMDFVNGLKHNSYKHYSPYGTVSVQTNYYCGDRHGSYTHNDLVGNLRLTDEYTFGDEHGTTTRFYHNKNKMFEYTQLDGMHEGEYKYYNQKGEPVLIVGYQNNAPVYYRPLGKSGEIADKIAIVNETAVIVSSYANGSPAIKLNYVGGELEGKLSIYNPDSKLVTETNYKHDLADGERIEFYPSGKIYKREQFKNGDYEGMMEYFKEDGKPWLMANYRNNELHGDTLIYTNGILAITKKYDSNELVAIIK